jgi:very-short-patch-repair endonuclease
MPFDIDVRIAEWRKQLLDTTKRNRLIKFVAGRIGGIDLVRPSTSEFWTRLVRDDGTLTFPWKRNLLGLPREVVDADMLAADYDPQRGTLDPRLQDIAHELTEACLRSPNLKPNHLLTEFTDRQLAARLTRLWRTAHEAATDHGVTTLYAAFGFLKWFEDEAAKEELRSPLLLVPIRLRRDTVESEYTLGQDEEDILPNHCLAELLRTQFGIQWPTETEVALDSENPDCLPNYLAAIRERIKHIPKWEVVDSAAIGVFNFQKLAMWEDLGRNGKRIKDHEMCRAIAGDNEVSLEPPPGMPAAADLDRLIAPETATHILDADSSQHEAIEAVKAGAHLVMDGPPGTGKSQTIANIIAEALAVGRTVLFVSEKTAALDVVKRRLDRCRLGDFCLELHSHRASKKLIVAELGRCLELPPAPTPDIANALRQLKQNRQKLNEFVAELHAVREPLGWSAFRVHGELARLDRGGARSRIPIKDVFEKKLDYVRQGAEILAALADCGAVVSEPGGHPWRGCKLTQLTHTARDDAEYQVGRLSDVIPPAEKAVAALAGLGFATEPSTVLAWRDCEADARRVASAPIIPNAWFRDDVRKTAAAVVELDQGVRDARTLATKLPECDPAALRRLDDVAAVTGLIPDRERAVDGLTLTLRARAQVLKRIESALVELSRIAGDIHTASRNVAGFLQIIRTPTADHLGVLADVAIHLSEGRPIPLDWWEQDKRAEILQLFADAELEERTLAAERTTLLERLHAEALDPESLTLVVDAVEQSASFWNRLWPHWRRMRQHLHSWYRSGTPSFWTLRSDLLRLERYHRRSAELRQVMVQFSSELAMGADGKPDWEASAERVRAIDWLERVGVQHTFKAVAGPRKTLNRASLGDAAAELKRLTTEMQNNWSKLLTEFAVPDPPAQLARGAAELAEWFADEAGAVRKEVTGLEAMIAALQPNKDVLPGVFRERAGHFRGLVMARSKVAAACRVLGDTRSADELDGADHSAEAERGKNLLAALKEFAKPISPAVVAAFTDKTTRDKLTAALRLSESARKPFEKAWERVTTDLFNPDVEVSTTIVLNRLPLGDLKKWASDRANDGARLEEWTKFAKVEQDVSAFGLSALLDEVKAGEIPPAEAADAFRARFFRLWLDALHQRAPILGTFTSEAHDRLVAHFTHLDRLLIRATPERVRSKLLSNKTRPVAREGAPEGSELGLLLREVNKRRRHIPLRRLFAQIPSILPRIKPCLMMSPLAVSTYLDSPELKFDLVIFDEASQVRPHDAVAAIYRGKQLVVGGDPRQLPPTDFFMRAGEEPEGTDSDDGGTAPFESLLDVCLALGLPRKPLLWHYRSRREGLIAFSNHHFYDGRLVTFPSAVEATGPALAFHRVADGRFKDGINTVEARRVAELVLGFARNTPQRSLGVIAFSQKQQDRILDELEVLRRASPGTESFFGEGRDDPFFVKNLENVQGDERDVIFISVGYGPDETGTVAMRFGPLNRIGGERRLNVAITRARQAMTVISSMTAADVDLTRTGAVGAKLLKAFLDFAERGAEALPEVEATKKASADFTFEHAVAVELARRGLMVEPRVGLGGYIVDLAVTDPDHGGNYVLGIECDGATYRSGATARDRDRLRRAVLEGLGWRLMRIWSTDWVRDREKQVRRILAAIEAGKQPPSSPAPPSLELDYLPPAAHRLSSIIDYDSIDAVPQETVNKAILRSLTVMGSMPLDDLVAVVAKRLRFRRAGQRIRERVAYCVNELLRIGKLVVGEGDRVRLTQLPRP